MTKLEQMIKKYDTSTIDNKKNAIKEVIQELVLASLSKTDFFKHAAFYGGTALRIFYDLNRFSEDLDFTLITSKPDFTLEKYFKSITNTIRSYGLEYETTLKDKSIYSNIESAFLKGNTKESFLIFYPLSDDDRSIIHNEKIQIKFEIDLDPPPHATFETKYRLLPHPYQVNLYDKESLFAGKIHVLLARKWLNRVKGRDLYDYIFYLSKDIRVNLLHLESRLKQTKTIGEETFLTKELLIKLLNKKFDEINYIDAKNDVLPFVKDVESLELWNKGFFKAITKELKVI